MMLSHLPAAPLNERACSAHQDQRIQDAWKEYRTGPGGVHVDSFQQAAHAHGIAGGVAEAIQCFEELANSRHGDKGRMLRQLFVTLVVETDAPALELWNKYGEANACEVDADGRVDIPVLWRDIYDSTCQQLGDSDTPPYEQCRNAGLLDLRERIESHGCGKDISSFLPGIDIFDVKTELQREQALYNR